MSETNKQDIYRVLIVDEDAAPVDLDGDKGKKELRRPPRKRVEKGTDEPN